MAAVSGSVAFQEVTNSTGRRFRVGETDRDILGYRRTVILWAAWLAMCLSGLLEYTWGTVAGSLQAAHHWSLAQTFWAFSFFVVFESFVQIFTGYLRNRGYLTVRWATIIGGIVCGIVGYGLLATSTGGVAALIMTGTLYGTAHFHWGSGFFFGASIGALAALVIGLLCKPPTVEQMEAAVRGHADASARKGGTKPAVAA